MVSRRAILYGNAFDRDSLKFSIALQGGQPTWMIKKLVCTIICFSVLLVLIRAGSAHANDALEISMIQAGDQTPETLSKFHPQFTYPIFGDEEQIFGYQGLKINLRFSAHTLRPNLQILYEKKFKSVGDTKAMDIEETLREWVPGGEDKARYWPLRRGC